MSTRTSRALVPCLALLAAAAAGCHGIRVSHPCDHTPTYQLPQGYSASYQQHLRAYSKATARWLAETEVIVEPAPHTPAKRP